MRAAAAVHSTCNCLPSFELHLFAHLPADGMHRAPLAVRAGECVHARSTYSSSHSFDAKNAQILLHQFARRPVPAAA